MKKARRATSPKCTGLPAALEAGIESLSGMDVSDARVHRNSHKPAELNAQAYAQGSDIHLASGQERHLPHEVWRVIQQAPGRVRTTMQKRAQVPVSDDVTLEREADEFGAKAIGNAPNGIKRDNQVPNDRNA